MRTIFEILSDDNEISDIFDVLQEMSQDIEEKGMVEAIKLIPDVLQNKILDLLSDPKCPLKTTARKVYDFCLQKGWLSNYFVLARIIKQDDKLTSLAWKQWQKLGIGRSVFLQSVPFDKQPEWYRNLPQDQEEKEPGGDGID